MFRALQEFSRWILAETFALWFCSKVTPFGSSSVVHNTDAGWLIAVLIKFKVH